MLNSVQYSIGSSTNLLSTFDQIPSDSQGTFLHRIYYICPSSLPTSSTLTLTFNANLAYVTIVSFLKPLFLPVEETSFSHNMGTVFEPIQTLPAESTPHMKIQSIISNPTAQNHYTITFSIQSQSGYIIVWTTPQFYKQFMLYQCRLTTSTGTSLSYYFELFLLSGGANPLATTIIECNMFLPAVAAHDPIISASNFKWSDSIQHTPSQPNSHTPFL